MFKNLKFQLLASSIIAIILIACFIAFAANGYLIISIVFAVIIAAYIVCVNVWFDVYVSKPIQDLPKRQSASPPAATALRSRSLPTTRSAI